MVVQLDKLKKQIDKHTVISFDIFDTLIMRVVNIPEQVFDLIGSKMGISDFREIREYCQRIASEQAMTKNRPHANLDEIYSCISERYGNRDVDWNAIKSIELETEKDCLYDNTEMHEVLRYAKERGKRVILTSDMYLNTEQVIDLLLSCGYKEYDTLYVSADVHHTKYIGDIYDFIAEKEGVSPKSILHIGDSEESDYNNAKQRGWKSFLYKNEFVEKKHIDKDEFMLSRGLTNKINYRNDSFWYMLGSYVGGPLYLGLVDWVKEQISQIGYKKIYFLSRDGYILYELLKDDPNYDCEYVYTSRRAMLLAGIDRLDDAALAMLPPFTTGQTVQYILEYIDMTDVCINHLTEVGLSMDYVIKDLDDYEKVRRLYKICERDFLDRCAVERANAKKYFESIGFFDEDSIVFDCGWKGTSQYLLDRCLKTMGYSKNNYFLYAGILSSDVSKKQLYNKNYKCYLFDVDTPIAERRSVYDNIVIFELFFGAPDKSVLKYSSEGIVYEELETDFVARESIFQGVQTYLNAVKYYTEVYNISVDKDTAIQSVIRLIEKPSVEEAITIGNVKNVDGYGTIEGLDKYIAKLDEETYKRYPDIDIYWIYGLLARPDISPALKRTLSEKCGVAFLDAPIQKKRRKIIKNKYNKNMFDYSDLYQLWIKDQNVDIYETEQLEYNPLFSVVIPVYNVEDVHLCACIDSVISQTYSNWELILVDDASSWKNVRKTLAKYETISQIRVIYRNVNGHISAATNDGIEISNGDYIAFMDCDDVIAPNALYEFAKAINQNPELEFIYSDEDKLSEDGSYRHGPFFKPDWSYDTFMSIMYTNHLALYRSSIVKELGGLITDYNGAQDYEFTLRFIEKINHKNIGHISKVLYYWRERQESLAINPNAKPYAVESVRKAKKATLERLGIKGRVEYVKGLNQYRVVYDVVDNPRVTVILVGRDVDNSHISEVEANISYSNIDIVHIDSLSQFGTIMDKVGEYLLFLDNATIVRDNDWFVRMLGHAQQSHTGAVGAKILYNNTDVIYHAGISIQEIGPVYSLQGMEDHLVHYYCRNRVEYNVMAVSMSCLMVSKEKLIQAGGIDSNLSFESAGIDLCIRLWKSGFFNVIRNDAVVYTNVNQDDVCCDWMHEDRNIKDPFYNDNLSPTRNDFSVRISNNSLLYNKRKNRYLISTNKLPRQMFSVDRCENELHYIYISGWYYVLASWFSNRIKVCVILMDEQGKINVFDSYKVVREDVGKVLNNNAHSVGFDCFIQKTNVDLESGVWKIGLGYCGIEQKCIHVVWTDKTLQVE